MKATRTIRIPMPKKVNSLPDVPEDGNWNVVRRIAQIIRKRYDRMRDNPTARITKKELLKEQYNDMIQTSDNNIIANATPKQREAGFGMFMDGLLADTRFQEDFKDALYTVKEETPDKFVGFALQMEKMRHPVDKNVNVDINLEVKQNMYKQLSEQYKYSQMVEIEDAEVIETKQLPEPSKNFEKMMAFQYQPEDEETNSSTFHSEITNEEE